MAIAYTDTVLNYSGMLVTKTDNSTRLLDAVFERGRRVGDGIEGVGRRKVLSTEFAMSSAYSVEGGAQPAISEADSVEATIGNPVTRDQKTNYVQIFQEAVEVSYLKASAIGNLSGLNIAGARSNVADEFDFQAAMKLQKIKKDLNYTLINGTKQNGSTNATAYKSAGLITNITSNVLASETPFGTEMLDNSIVAALKNGFSPAADGLELWVNPADLSAVNKAYASLNGFGLPMSRTEGGVAINNVMTQFGQIRVEWDPMIPKNTMLLLNLRELAIAFLDTIVKDKATGALMNRGSFFYEDLAKKGASDRGQLYGQAGIDCGAEWHHIKLTVSPGA